VERPGGEDARLHEPFVNGESLYVMIYNRNKYGITLRTRHPKAHDLLIRLIEWADVLVENFRPGTLAKMGLGTRNCGDQSASGDHVHLRIRPDRSFGPAALFDSIAQAMSV